MDVNGDTDFGSAPGYEIGKVIFNVITYICALQQAVGAEVTSHASKMDVKGAFRRIQAVQ